jgi:hypothetical protein
MATIFDSAIGKLSKKTAVILPREMSAIIRKFEELTPAQKKLLKKYLSIRTISAAQQKALIDTDPKFAIMSLGHLDSKVQDYFLKTYNKMRGMMFSSS